MKFLVEQTAEQIQQASPIVNDADLLLVRLSRTSAHGALPTIPLTAPINVNVGQRGGKSDRQGELLVMSIEFRYVLADSASPPTEILTIVVEFEAHYKVPLETTYSEESQQAFAAGNLVFNCWSFFREYVQSTAVRMGFAAPPVPLLKIVTASPVPAQEQPAR